MDDDHDSEAPTDPPGMAALLEFLRRARGFDFTGYKEASLARRVERRMKLVGVGTYAEYTDYLEVHPDEFPLLFDMILINVTGFFRDPATWQAIASHLPKLLAARSGDAPIRAWSAGCASGEEAFTLATLLAEQMGLEAYAERVKIYATDIDEKALRHARIATYPAKAIEAVPPELAAKYVTQSGRTYVFNNDLRRSVIFGRHDLVHDAPISRVDILMCRNTLMYFNAETQRRILSRLHFALNDDGLLVAGKAEMLLTHANSFRPVDLKFRIFSRASNKTKRRDGLPALQARTSSSGGAPRVPRTFTSERKPEGARARPGVVESSPNAVIMIDAEGRLALADGHARHLFGLKRDDVGRPFQELEMSYRPIELRSWLDAVRAEKRSRHVREVGCVIAGEPAYLDITATPFFDEALEVTAVQIVFVDVTHHLHLRARLRGSNADLETAREELQSTCEELETTNAVLRSTVEELEGTNDELQSTNQELETLNEELQSANEELRTLNEELRVRGEELNRFNGFFDAILRSVHVGVAVLDPALAVQAWNGKMVALWGARAQEIVGRNFLNLDIGLSVGELAAPIRACVDGGGEIEKTVEGTNRRGEPVTCKVFITRLAEDRGVIVLIEEQTSA